MKCSRCGSANRSDARVCYRCGQVLDPGTPEAPGSPQDSQIRDTPAAVWAPPPKKSKGRRVTPLLALRDDEDPDQPEADEAGAPPPPRAGLDRLRTLRSGQDMHVVMLNTPKPHLTPKQQRHRAYARRRIIASVILLALLAGIGYGGTRLFLLARSAYRDWRAERIAASLPKAPLVERVMLDGALWHKITFYGEDGERVMLTDPQESKAILNGTAEFFIEDSYFLSQKDEDERQITVSLKAVLYATDGTQTDLSVDEYTITLPDSPLKVISPAQQDTTTNENRIPIKLKTTPGSRVLINGDNVSDYLDTSGYLSLSVKLDPIGTNNIDIVIETPGHYQTQYTLRVNRPEIPITFTLDTEPPANTYDDSLQFTGQIEPGTSIETDAKLSGDADSITVGADGSFDFTVAFSRYGENLITLNLSTPDGRTAQVVYSINRTPKKNTYSSKAWAIDYSYLSSSTNALIGKVYMCQGTVVSKLDVEGESYYEFNVGTSEAPQIIIIEYTTDQFLGYTSIKELQVGTVYTLFADVIGTYNDYPLLVARDMKLE